jgi:hypothetical protein
MGGSLNQPCRVQDEGPMGRKLLFQGKNRRHACRPDGTLRISIG